MNTSPSQSYTITPAPAAAGAAPSHAQSDAELHSGVRARACGGDDSVTLLSSADGVTSALQLGASLAAGSTHGMGSSASASPRRGSLRERYSAASRPDPGTAGEVEDSEVQNLAPVQRSAAGVAGLPGNDAEPSQRSEASLDAERGALHRGEGAASPFGEQLQPPASAAGHSDHHSVADGYASSVQSQRASAGHPRPVRDSSAEDCTGMVSQPVRSLPCRCA